MLRVAQRWAEAQAHVAAPVPDESARAAPTPSALDADTARVLAAFGATVPALDVAYSRARTVQFSYTNVTSTVVPPLALLLFPPLAGSMLISTL